MASYLMGLDRVSCGRTSYICALFSYMLMFSMRCCVFVRCCILFYGSVCCISWSLGICKHAGHRELYLMCSSGYKCGTICSYHHYHVAPVLKSYARFFSAETASLRSSSCRIYGNIPCRPCMTSSASSKWYANRFVACWKKRKRRNHAGCSW